jgi:hypothetical protein
MEATAILAPNERSVRGKIQLFLRLWIARQKYEQLRPFGTSSGARLRFHLAHLEYSWSRVVNFQKVLGLDTSQFLPREQFETIYIVSAFASRELRANLCATDRWREKWFAYEKRLSALSHDLNPFDFGEACLHCSRAIQELANPETPPEADPPIPLARRETESGFIPFPGYRDIHREEACRSPENAPAAKAQKFDSPLQTISPDQRVCSD